MGKKKTLPRLVFYSLVSVCFILFSANFILVNALVLKSSSATATVNLNQNVQIKCNFGVVLACIGAVHGNQGCTFVGFSGTTATFNCPAKTAGLISNYCNLFGLSGDSRCIPQTNKIQSTNVIGPKVVLKSSSAPASVNVGQSFQIKCDFGISFFPCIYATSGGNNCIFSTFSGTTAIFNCNASKTGVQDNYCNLYNYASDSRCIAQTNKIAGTTVVSNCVPSCSGRQCGSDGCGGSCGSCSFSQTCNSTGQCINPIGPIRCAQNSDCGTNGYTGNPICQSGNVYQNYLTYTCNNPGLVSSTCSTTNSSQLKQTCNSGQSCANGQCVNNYVYSVQKVNVGNTVENRLYYNQIHFMTIISDANGAIAIRPHPGLDVNGWGSSLYLEPFVPGAVLRGTTINNLNVKSNGIEVVASGIISNGASSSLGTWNSDILFSFDPSVKDITGTGKYNIYASTTGSEIDLYKLASNYLVNVPLLNGSVGDTGDMKYANVTGDLGNFFNLIWIPKSGSTFPQDNLNPIAIEAVGDYNQVDTANQGYAAIAAAYKPSMKISLNSSRSSEDIIFGGIYDSSESQQFWQDNVGITPLVQRFSPYTTYNFDVQFDSKAIPGDH